MVLDQFSHPKGGMGRNIIIFGVDLLNSVHVTNKTQNILILGQCLHYNGGNSYLFVNGKEVNKFKAKNLKLKQTN